MKRKLLLASLVLVGAVSTNVMAYQIQKGKVIEHKEWTTGNAKGSFIAKHVDQIAAKKLMGDGYSYIYSKANSSKSLAGSVANLTGDHFISVENASKQAQEYHYVASVCASTADKVENCIFYFDKIELEPGGSFFAELNPELQVSFEKAGSYGFSVSTYLGSNDSTSSTNSNSSASSTIEVS